MTTATKVNATPTKLYKYLQGNLTESSFKQIVKLPVNTTLEDWLTIVTLEIFDNLWIIYDSLSIGKRCTHHTCSALNTGKLCEYLWNDMKHSSPNYIRLLTRCLSQQMYNSPVFHAVPKQASNFAAIIKNICQHLFRIFFHLFHCHLQEITALNTNLYLNTCFKHFWYFTQEFDLVEKELFDELKQHLISSSTSSISVNSSSHPSSSFNNHELDNNSNEIMIRRDTFHIHNPSASSSISISRSKHKSTTALAVDNTSLNSLSPSCHLSSSTPAASVNSISESVAEEMGRKIKLQSPALTVIMHDNCDLIYARKRYYLSDSCSDYDESQANNRSDSESERSLKCMDYSVIDDENDAKSSNRSLSIVRVQSNSVIYERKYSLSLYSESTEEKDSILKDNNNDSKQASNENSMIDMQLEIVDDDALSDQSNSVETDSISSLSQLCNSCKNCQLYINQLQEITDEKQRLRVENIELRRKLRFINANSTTDNKYLKSIASQVQQLKTDVNIIKSDRSMRLNMKGNRLKRVPNPKKLMRKDIKEILLNKILTV